MMNPEGSFEEDTDANRQKRIDMILEQEREFNERKEKENSQKRPTVSKSTITYGNKYGHHYIVPEEIYSAEPFRERLNSASTLAEVEQIIDDYKRHNRKEPEQPTITVTPCVPRKPYPQTVEPTEKRRKVGNRKALLAALLAVVLVASLILLSSINNPSSHTNSPSSTPNTSNGQEVFTLYLPGVLDNYALSLINTDRQANGLQNITLSSINSGQVHADDMLKNGYFSHWDMNGYKPYMRYTLAGGQGAVEENIAWEGQAGSSVSIDVELTLKNMEWQMMYNDSAENWGHRDNILNPLHNEVSIGIAYDYNNVYFVEDFINDYISWNQLSANSSQVIMQGTTETQGLNITQIDVFYDNPTPLTVNQLGQAPYEDGYDMGTYAAIVVPPALPDYNYDWSGTNVTGIVADNWNQNGNSFQISFSLSQAIATYGNGIYTLCMETSTTNSIPADSLTTYSVWIN
jgi:uncharacterized protein YkwD